ncbi:MAG: alpha/beta fold hydrolase [Burkholderia sp.]|nr:alpha/beta fold hydrolase [Burkholderia sp.]
MIVRITRTLLVLQLLVACAIAATMIKVFHFDKPVVAMIIGLGVVLLVRMQITANNFILSSRYSSVTPDACRLSRWQSCKLFLYEFRSTMTASSYTMPFHAFTKRVAENPSALPVLLIHGYGCNSGYWHMMSKQLAHAQITHYAVNMEPVMGDIDDYVPVVHEGVEAMCKETGSDKIIIVAHSMGGLAARAYLRAHGSARIAKVITLGTPHHGTGVANFGAGTNCQQMRWTVDEGEGASSEWLRQLDAGETADDRKLLVSIFSHHDNIISPQTSSFLPGATNIEFHGVGHVALAFSPRVQARVVAEIREASRAPAAAPSSATASPLS